MNEVRKIPLTQLRVRSDARQVDFETVDALASSIGSIGHLLNPIVVRERDEGLFEIVAGAHRFMACDKLEWEEAPCRVEMLDDVRAELAMIDENLCRAELKGVLRDQQTARRKAIYEALHPETRHGANATEAAISRWSDASRQVGDTHSKSSGSSPSDRFTTETAALTGQSERTVQRSAERGEKIAREAANLMAGTRLDTGTYADRIKDRPAAEQVETVRRDLAAPRDQKSPNARPAAKPNAQPGEAFTRFLALADEIEGLGVRDIIAAAGRQRSLLGQRASGLGSMMDDIGEGLTNA